MTLLSKIFDNLNEGIIIHQKDTSISYFNKSALKILKLSSHEIMGKDAHDSKWFFIDEDGKKLSLEQYPVVKVLNSKKNLENMVMGLEKLDSKTIWVNVNGIPVLDESGEIDYIVISFINITKQKEALSTVYQKTYFNRITNLPNILKLEESLKEDNVIGLLALEIQNFNHLYQYYGSKLFHEILRFTAFILNKHFKNSIFQIDSSKFAIVLKNKKFDLSYIQNFIKQMNKDGLYYEKLGINLSLVSGLSYEKNEVILTAQAALTKAKIKNEELFLYSKKENLSLELNNEIFWSQALRVAIKEENIIPVFQPIVNNDTLKIEKYEVLMRLKVDEVIYNPASFLEISKKIKLYKYLTIILIEKVFKYFENKNIPFSINLNTEDLMSDEIKTILLNKIQKFHTPSNISIEIVESEGIDNFKDVNRFLNTLKIYGCKIGIDDFGSGYSNFEYILKLDADYIKIDGSLIKDIDENQISYDIVKTIVGFAKTRNLPIVAEFVSSEDIYNMINELGIDYSQGFYFGKPEFDVLDTPDLKKKKDKGKKKKFKQLIYASDLNGNIPLKEIEKLFEGAIKRNKESKITGYILFDGKSFLQIIEGEESKINQLYEKIVIDKRHTNIFLIGTKETKIRDFEEWGLGYITNKKIIHDFIYKTTKKHMFLPHQYSYEEAFVFLEKLQKII